MYGNPLINEREVLLSAALRFTQAASRLTGVLRIALLGSIVTKKLDPKDIDLLVTVSDEMELEPLATLGRKLKGAAQQINHGADIFLADPHGRYIGRTCQWKTCAPGIRMSCHAQNCGQRQYLYDDFHVIRLKEELIMAPPVDLWPDVISRVEAPQDVEMLLLQPLRAALLRDTKASNE